MRSLFTSGRVHVRDLLDLVGAMDGESNSIEDAVRQIYDWHNGRSVTGMQLTFAPVAAAVLAVIAKPTLGVFIGAGLIVLIALLLGAVAMVTLNWLHGEYVLALRLIAELKPLRRALGPHPHGMGARPGSVAGDLYAKDVGDVSMVDYRAHPSVRCHVLSTVTSCLERVAEDEDVEQPTWAL